MAVQLESAARLAALRDKADAVTGESSATLAGAVDALIAGFGAGGVDIEAFEDGIFGGDGGVVGLNRRFPNDTYTNNRITVAARYAFAYFKNVKKLELPNVINISYHAFDTFNNGSDPIGLVFPSVVTVREGAFQSAHATVIDLPKVETIEASAFQYMGAVTIIIRNTEKMCTTNRANRLFDASTGWEEGTYIYVPKKFLSDDDSTMDYRRATNWVTYAAIFRALEDYTEDGTTTGELDPNKI